MYSVTVRESVMIAHSLKDPAFGPAQNLHGATFVVDFEFLSESLTAKNVVIDIGAARDAAKKVLEPLAYRNLDDMAEFDGKLTTAEFIARHIHDAMKTEVGSVFNGRLRISLRETHDAWASYEG